MSVDAIILTIILLFFATMETTRLSSKGQVIIPKTLRDAHHWLAGQELIAINTGDGIVVQSYVRTSKVIGSEVMSNE